VDGCSQRGQPCNPILDKFCCDGLSCNPGPNQKWADGKCGQGSVCSLPGDSCNDSLGKKCCNGMRCNSGSGANWGECAKLYRPYGPQIDVPLATIKEGGWRFCYARSYAKPWRAAGFHSARDKCNSTYVMVGCTKRHSGKMATVAWAPREDVFAETKGQCDGGRVSQGTRWYMFPKGSAVRIGNKLHRRRSGYFGFEDQTYDCSVGFKTEDNRRARKLAWLWDTKNKKIGGISCGENYFLKKIPRRRRRRGRGKKNRRERGIQVPRRRRRRGRGKRNRRERGILIRVHGVGWMKKLRGKAGEWTLVLYSSE